MSGSKTFKRGDIIFREGDRIQSVFFIQSGQASAQLPRKSPIELMSLRKDQVAGEVGLAGQATHSYTLVATAETTLIEVPIDAMKAQVEMCPPAAKKLIGPILDRNRELQKELRSIRVERDSVPVPSDQLAKVLASVYHSLRHKAVRDEKSGLSKISWSLFKNYVQRMFGENPKRAEQVISMLVKFGRAQYVMEKPDDDPKAPEEISGVVLKDYELLEAAAEFWQYYYFKGAKPEFLRTDERVMQVVASLVDQSADLTADRNGVVHLEFSKFVETYRRASGQTLNAEFFSVIEQKGLFLKRHPTDQGVILQFERSEFERWLNVWMVLKEIEKWNEKGSVDSNEPAFDPRKFQKSASAGESSCPACHHVLDGAPKFCPECGQRLAQAA